MATGRKKVFFSTLFGTGVGAIVMLPLTACIAAPLGKLVEWLGLINRATTPDRVASILVTTSMLEMWLIEESVIGTLLLYLTIRKPGRADFQTHLNMACSIPQPCSLA
jgi:hypothetical protein